LGAPAGALESRQLSRCTQRMPRLRDPELIGRLREAWPVAVLLGAFGIVTVTFTQGVLTQTGRFPTLLVSLIAMSGWLALAVAIACLTLVGRARFSSLALLVAAAMALPTAALVIYRWHTGIPLAVNDGMFQTEIVTGNLLAGHDPYGTDFTHTELLRWFSYVPANSSVPYHYEYYPLVVLVSVPVALVERLFHLGIDLRPLVLLGCAIAFGLITKLPWSWRWRYALAVLLFLDPFFGFIEGRSDILWLVPMLAAVLFALDGRWTAASWAIGVAAAFKLFAFPFAFFMAAVLWFRWRRGEVGGRAVLLAALGLVAPLLLTSIPFLIWNAGAFWGDTLGQFLETPARFPMYGIGLGEALLITHVVADPMAPFPFAAVQAVLAIPLVVLGLRTLSGRPSLANLLGASTTILAVIVLFGRVTNTNYVTALFFLYGLSIATARHERARESAARPKAA